MWLDTLDVDGYQAISGIKNIYVYVFFEFFLLNFFCFSAKNMIFIRKSGSFYKKSLFSY